MAIIYFDEAGNTGSDLMNKEQTLYVLCSSVIQENEAKTIVENYFGKNRNVHFKNLKQSKINQKIILNLFDENTALFKDKFRSCFYHKKYLILCQMLNHLYEPQLYEDGIDYYDGGMNIAHANMFYVCSYGFCGENKIDALLNAFVNMIRIKTNKEINLFFKVLEDAIKNCKREDFKADLYILLRIKDNINEYISSLDKYILDPAMHALIGLVEQWLKELNEGIDIIHDRSNSVNVTKKYLEMLVNINTQPINIGYGEFKTLLPLKVNSFKFESSELSYSIQLCDILASSIFFINNEKEEIDKKDFKNELTNIIKNWNTYGSVSPTLDVSIDQKRKKQEGDINTIDYLAFKKWKNNF
jgi:hypothetical protein